MYLMTILRGERYRGVVLNGQLQWREYIPLIYALCYPDIWSTKYASVIVMPVPNVYSRRETLRECCPEGSAPMEKNIYL